MPQEHDLELSEYGISKNRYRELKYFCRQYREKKQQLAEIRSLSGMNYDGMPHGSGVSDTTASKAIKALQLAWDVALIEDTARQVDPLDWDQIVRHVADGVPYEHLNLHSGRRQFYKLRHMYFWLLDQAKAGK